MTELLVPARFCGPASSGNGGWTAGALAGLVAPDDPGPVEVTLRQPPPLDVPLPVTDGVAVAADGSAVAAARVVDRDLDAVEPVSAEAAAAAESTYAGLVAHPFPTCFACGTGREEGDGLRIFPGRVADDSLGRVRVAATWTPHASQADDWHVHGGEPLHASLAVAWAALDCVGGWAGDLEERLMVLGRMTARVDALPAIGATHVVGRRRAGLRGPQDLHRRDALRPLRSGGRCRRARLARGRRCGLQRGMTHCPPWL